MFFTITTKPIRVSVGITIIPMSLYRKVKNETFSFSESLSLLGSKKSVALKEAIIHAVGCVKRFEY